MTARILVVDDLEPNVKLLEAKLSAEYFDVVTAMEGERALQLANDAKPDVILLDVMMPGLDGFEICKRLKGDAATAHIPVIMVTALDQQSDRVTGLEAGADDFLTKPVDDIALFARVKNLARLKMMTDELRLREATSEELGIVQNYELETDETKSARIYIVDDQPDSAKRLVDILCHDHFVNVESSPENIAKLAAAGETDLFIVSLNLADCDSLRLCSQVRSIEEARHTPLLAVVEPGDTKRLVRALEIGVNDYVSRPVDENELRARVRTQLKRKQYTERLRQNFHLSLELAVTDQLTGLYNRRYLASHLRALIEQVRANKRPLSLMMFDIDHFKPINDTHGHDAGDQVLKEFANRIARNVRGLDLACRYGGEEFVVAMPDTDKAFATMVAERLRQDVADEPFDLPNGQSVDVTISIGVAVADADENVAAQELVKRADDALYEAKNAGRNRVVAPAA